MTTEDASATHLVLLPGLDGTDVLFEPLQRHLTMPATAVAYPQDVPGSYADLLPFVLDRLPTDREYVLLWDDADSRWNTASSAASLPDYDPNYFIVNGLAFPDTGTDPDTRVVGFLGERILLRNLNAGRLRQAIHFHGYHSEIAARNNVPVTNMPPKDTWPLPGSSTLDLILTPNQTGVFPLHPHHVTSVTANGLYPFGQLVLQDIQ